jgi:hypothetical protein
MMLQIVPTHWYSWNVTVRDASRPVAAIATSWWREKGTLTIDGVTYRVSREAPLFGAFVLEHAGRVLAQAEKPSIFRRAFVIRHAGRAYTLRPESMFRRAFVLRDGSRPVGSITPTNFLTRKAAADLPDDLPLPVRMFIVWLTVISWRRDQSS